MATDTRDQQVKNREVATGATDLRVKMTDMVTKIIGLIVEIKGLKAEIIHTIERGDLKEIIDQETGIGKEITLEIEMRDKTTQGVLAEKGPKDQEIFVALDAKDPMCQSSAQNILSTKGILALFATSCMRHATTRREV